MLKRLLFAFRAAGPILALVCVAVFLAGGAPAQVPERGSAPDDAPEDAPDDAGTDSRFTPALTEIVVTGRSGLGASFETRQTVGLEAIEKVGAASVAETLRLVPAAHVQTNSRGESLIFLRNAGERQVAVFFDGALLNIPWDNRVDLSLVPANILGGVTTSKGATSIQYGANVIGGAVNLTSREPGEATEVETALRRGSRGLWDASATVAAGPGDVRLLATAGYSRRDGVPLPDGADLPFSQTGTKTRTNTDAERANALLRGEMFVNGDSEIALTMLYLDAEKGIAPEGHIDPDVGSVRFWRYPQWRTLMAIANGRFALGGGTLLTGSAWVQEFDQTIDSHETAAFETLAERQLDDNLTVGGRFTLQHELTAAQSLLVSFNGLLATHRQRNIAFDGGHPVDADVPRQTFRQRTISLGAEYDATLSPAFDIELGVGLDSMAALRTGDKPPIGDFVDYTLTAAGVWSAGPAWRLRAAAGRKTRFPTLRELFGEAVNRFLINPDLQPESAWIGELGAAWTGRVADLELVAFASLTDDTIDRRNVTVDGRRLRQRINLRGSCVLGIEASGSVDMSDRLVLAGHLAVMDVDRRPDQPGETRKIAEKPRVIGRAALDYTGPRGVTASAEIVHRGRAFSRDEDNRFVPLEVSTVLNLQAGLALDRILPRAPDGRLYLRLDNVTDTVAEPQLGLPGPGRWISGGLRARF